MPAISKARTPTLDFLTTSLVVGAVVRTASNLWDMAVLTLKSNVSRAMVRGKRKKTNENKGGGLIYQGDKKAGRGKGEEEENN